MISSKKFTLLELLVVIAIIAILASMILPSINQAMLKAKTIKCNSNQGQMGKAFSFYSADFNDYICPYRDTQASSNVKYWDKQLLQEYLNDNRPGIILGGYIWISGTRFDSKLACPLVPTPESGSRYSYGINSKFSQPVYKSSQFKRPSRGCLLAESDKTTTASICYYQVNGNGTSENYVQWFPHNNSENILFLDFHSALLKRIKVPDSDRDGASARLSSFWDPVTWTNENW